MLTRFAQVFPNHGFDGAPKPPWVMVRQGNFNWAYMLGDQKVTLKLTKPGIVKVVPQNTAYRFTNAGVEFKKTNKKAQVLRLEGLTAGTVFVEAYNGATRVARLEVAVKKKKMLKVAFNFVQDSGGHTTTRKQGHVDRWVKNVNRILEPQANVSVVKGKVGSVTVSKNLGSVVKVTKWRGRPKDEMPDVTKHRDAKADINVFLV